MTGQVPRILMSAALALVVSGGARAQETPAPVLPPPALLTEEAERAQVTAPVVIDGRELFRVRGFAGYPAEQRAGLIAERIQAAARDASVPSVKLAPSPEGFRIAAGDRFLMAIVDADARLMELKPEILAALYVPRIEQALSAYREARTPAVMWRAVQQATLATLLLAVAIPLGLVGLGRLDRRIARSYDERIRSVQIQSFEIVRAQRLRGLLRGLTHFVRFSVLATLAYGWLQFVLGRFPQTRPLAERLLQLLLEPLGRLASGLVAQLPSLAFLLVLFFLTRWTLRLVKLFFESVERRQVELSNFEPEWAMPTYRIVRVAIVAFALVVAYPYIPGSQSAAFQSISLFLGVIFSIGSSSVISNVIAGYSMTYRRAFHLGDRIQVGDILGEVTEIRLQVTHLRTSKNEEVVMPNSVLLNSHVVNYSVLARSRGLDPAHHGGDRLRDAVATGGGYADRGGGADGGPAAGADTLRAAEVARRFLCGVRDQRLLQRACANAAALLAAAPERSARTTARTATPGTTSVVLPRPAAQPCLSSTLRNVLPRRVLNTEKPRRSRVRISFWPRASARSTSVASAKSMGVSAYFSIRAAAASSSGGWQRSNTSMPLVLTSSARSRGPVGVAERKCIASVITALVAARPPVKLSRHCATSPCAGSRESR